MYKQIFAEPFYDMQSNVSSCPKIVFPTNISSPPTKKYVAGNVLGALCRVVLSNSAEYVRPIANKYEGTIDQELTDAAA